MLSLIITFCTVTTCEEYVIDGGKASPLTRSDCNRALQAERYKLDHMDSQVAYRSYMEQFKAEGLFDADSGVSWFLSCQG